MLLLGAFFALLTVGFWARRARSVRRPRRTVRPTGPAAEAAFRRHPAGRALTADGELATAQQPNAPSAWARPNGPDDDPEFLSELDRQIRGRRQRGHDA
jgi:hypothetical protein